MPIPPSRNTFSVNSLYFEYNEALTGCKEEKEFFEWSNYGCDDFIPP